ncbi:MAG: hypothetical protein ABIM89_12300 [Mycobacteriales bacterium]
MRAGSARGATVNTLVFAYAVRPLAAGVLSAALIEHLREADIDARAVTRETRPLTQTRIIRC